MPKSKLPTRSTSMSTGKHTRPHGVAPASAVAASSLRDYAISNPDMEDLVIVDRKTLIIPKSIDKPIYNFYRQKHTAPHWIYATALVGEKDTIVGVFNTVTQKIYHIFDGLVHANPEAFGYKNTRLKNHGGGALRRQTRHRQIRRQQTRRS